MTGQWEKYIGDAARAGHDAFFATERYGDNGELAPVKRNDVWRATAEAMLAAVAPLIEQDTRERLVAAAARAVEREGCEDPRAKIVSDLRWLAAARKEYCLRCPEHQGDMQAMGPTALAVHDDHDAAERLAGIVEGTHSARGWLPSWRWDEWEARQ